VSWLGLRRSRGWRSTSGSAQPGERVEAKGKAWGRPQWFTEADREHIRAMKLAGRSIRQIAAAVKCPRATVARALKAKGATA
jgi:hypothetical protein